MCERKGRTALDYLKNVSGGIWAMADVSAAGGNDGLDKMVAKIKDLQSQRAKVHREERSKILEKETGSPLLGQKISGLGQSIDRFA